LIADIDHFKQFNDAHGHEAGDVALQAVAAALERHFRESDVACRYGGEEFAVVLPGAGSEHSRERAERVLAAIGAMPIHYQGQNLGSVTLSIGLASWPEQVDNAEDLLSEADRALYRAKQLGRRRVEAV
jgi:diguanylate cyclase (GGDEF)-like protein